MITIVTALPNTAGVPPSSPERSNEFDVTDAHLFLCDLGLVASGLSLLPTESLVPSTPTPPPPPELLPLLLGCWDELGAAVRGRGWDLRSVGSVEGGAMRRWVGGVTKLSEIVGSSGMDASSSSLICSAGHTVYIHILSDV